MGFAVKKPAQTPKQLQSNDQPLRSCSRQARAPRLPARARALAAIDVGEGVHCQQRFEKRRAASPPAPPWELRRERVENLV